MCRSAEISTEIIAGSERRGGFINILISITRMFLNHEVRKSYVVEFYFFDMICVSDRRWWELLRGRP